MKITNEQLSAYLDNALTPEERAEVDRALAASPEIQRDLARLRQLGFLIQDLPTTEPSESFYSRVLEKTKPRSKAWLRWTIPLVGAAAAAMVMIFISGEKKAVFRQSMAGDQAFSEPTLQMSHSNQDRETDLNSIERNVQAKRIEGWNKSQSEMAEKLKNGTVAQKEYANELSREQKNIAPGLASASGTDGASLPVQDNSEVKLESEIRRGIAQEDRETYQREAASFVNPALQTKVDDRALSVSKKRVEPSVPIKPIPPSVSESQKVSMRSADKDIALKAPSAPQSMILPEESFLPRDWQGNSSGIREPREVIIKDASSWAKFWAEHQSNMGTPAPAPVVNFNKHMVIGIFVGDRGSSGFSVEITNIKEIGKETVVSYRETQPSSGRMQLSIMTQPYHLRAIPRTNYPIRFKKL